MIHISDIYTTAPTDKRIPLEENVYTMLQQLKIPYERVDNDPVFSMEECTEIDKALSVEIRKSIFLCNKKKTSFFLLVMPAGKSFDNKAFCTKLGLSNLSFASPEKMEEHLGVTPGSATVMGLMNDTDDYVQLIVDQEVADAPWFGCNPGINTSHLKFKTTDLLNIFLPHIRHKAKIMSL